MIITPFSKQLGFCSRRYIYIFKRFISQDRKWIKYKMADKNIPPHRSDPIIKKLETIEFSTIFTPELQKLSEFFKQYNYEIRIAGGAVRDLLMNKIPQDLDFATTATPTQMKDMFNKENIRMINNNGEKHGTITCRIDDKENFEVTTLRIDVVTDGRHADVEFTTDWLLDANRRDLTINSMFLDLDGNVYDYFYGYEDLLNRRVQFVGDPEERIQEDFLRIFRYFRFYGRIADEPNNHDEKTLKAISKNCNGLERISGERIWCEWTKIMDGNFHKELTIEMIKCGCSKYIGLPEEPNVENFDTLCSMAQKNNIKLRPISKVVALLNTEEDVINIFKRLKFTAYDRDLALFLVIHRNEIFDDKKNILKMYKSLILKTINSVANMREYVCELFRYRNSLDLLEEFQKWNEIFPINGKMVGEHLKVNEKAMTRDVIFRLIDIWLDSDCKTLTEELKSLIPTIIEEVRPTYEERMEKQAIEKKRAAQENKKNSKRR